MGSCAVDVFLQVILLCLINYSLQYKVLVFSPTNSRSHVISNARIADTLAKAGLDVLLLEAEFAVETNGVTTAKYARRKVLTNFDKDILGREVGKLSANAFAENKGWLTNVQYYREYYKAFTRQCDALLQNKEVLEELRKERFDIIFTEQLHLCGSGLKHVLNITSHLWVNSCPIMEHVSWILGLPIEMSYVPSVADVDVSDKMSVWQRISNIIETVGIFYVHMAQISATTEVFRRHYGPNFPSVEDLARDSPLLFVNVDELVDFPRPVFHNTIFIGGLGMETTSNVLSEPFASEMEKGKEGVVFFSFGSNTNTNSMPQVFLTNLFEAFSRLPHFHFIAKIDKGDDFSEQLARKHKNIFTTNWAPQNDLLGHKRMKAFVTHGGYNSLLETARHGVPIVTMPFFMDQYRNARVAERNGWGISFDKTKLLHGCEEFVSTLQYILEDPRFEENAKRTKHLLATKPFSAEERLVKYTKFVADNGGALPELQAEGRKMSLIAFYNLDIYIPLLCSMCVIVYGIVKTMLHFGRFFKRAAVMEKRKIQ